MMKRLLTIAIFLLGGGMVLSAHPGSGLAVDAQGRGFVAIGPFVMMLDTNGHSPTIVSDLTNEKFYQLHHIRRAPDGGMVTASNQGDTIWRFTAEGVPSRFYPGENQDGALRVGTGGDPFEVDGRGNIYAINSGQFRHTQTLMISPHGRISFVPGGDWGHADGSGAQARFADVHGGSFVTGPDGALSVTDDGRYVRRITREGVVSTLADSGNHRIRRIALSGQVSILAGSGAIGSADGLAAVDAAVAIKRSVSEPQNHA